MAEDSNTTVALTANDWATWYCNHVARINFGTVMGISVEKDLLVFDTSSETNQPLDKLVYDYIYSTLTTLFNSMKDSHDPVMSDNVAKQFAAQFQRYIADLFNNDHKHGTVTRQAAFSTESIVNYIRKRTGMRSGEYEIGKYEIVLTGKLRITVSDIEHKG